MRSSRLRITGELVCTWHIHPPEGGARSSGRERRSRSRRRSRRRASSRSSRTRRHVALALVVVGFVFHRPSSVSVSVSTTATRSIPVEAENATSRPSVARMHVMRKRGGRRRRRADRKRFSTTPSRDRRPRSPEHCRTPRRRTACRSHRRGRPAESSEPSRSSPQGSPRSKRQSSESCERRGSPTQISAVQVACIGRARGCGDHMRVTIATTPRSAAESTAPIRVCLFMVPPPRKRGHVSPRFGRRRHLRARMPSGSRPTRAPSKQG